MTPAEVLEVVGSILDRLHDLHGDIDVLRTMAPGDALRIPRSTGQCLVEVIDELTTIERAAEVLTLDLPLASTYDDGTPAVRPLTPRQVLYLARREGWRPHDPMLTERYTEVDAKWGRQLPRRCEATRKDGQRCAAHALRFIERARCDAHAVADERQACRVAQDGWHADIHALHRELGYT